MADELILLVERDAKTRRLLKVSLEQVGYAVESARDGVGALELLEVVSPALIIAATDLPKLDGYGLVRELKKHEEWSAIPLIFVVEAGSIESKIRGLELGVDEYIQKPIFVKELHSRVQVCLAKKVRHRLSTSVKETRVRGSLQDLPPVDLLETLETGRQSATLRMSSGGRLATVYIQEGEIIDAQLKRLRGEEVIYRVLTWSDGTYEVEVGDVDREPVVEASTRSLMEAGMRHAAEFQMLAADLPRSGVVLQPNRREVHERGGDIPEEIMAIVDLFDGRRTLLVVFDESPFDDLSTLSTVAKLLEEELLAVVAPGPTALDRTATPLHPSSDAASLTTGEDVDDTALTMRPPSVKAGRAAAQIDAGSIGQAAARAVAEPFVADTLASDRVGEIDEDETADGDEESVDDEDADRLAGLAGDRVDDGFDDDAFDASFLADPENGGRNAVGPPEGQAPPKTPPRGGSKHVRVSAMADERLADDERPTVALGDELAEFAPAGRITPAEGSGIFSAASLLDGEADDPPTVPFTRDKLVAPGRGRSTGARAGSHEGRGDDEEDASFKGSGEYDDDASFEGSGEYDDEASFEGSGEYDDDASFEGSGEYDDEASFEGSGEY
ncbi:MAG: response regulator, partial [Myxococcota bacterium]